MTVSLPKRKKTCGLPSALPRLSPQPEISPSLSRQPQISPKCCRNRPGATPKPPGCNLHPGPRCSATGCTSHPNVPPGATARVAPSPRAARTPWRPAAPQDHRHRRRVLPPPAPAPKPPQSLLSINSTVSGSVESPQPPGHRPPPPRGHRLPAPSRRAPSGDSRGLARAGRGDPRLALGKSQDH